MESCRKSRIAGYVGTWALTLLIACQSVHAEGAAPSAAQEEARQILQELQRRFEDPPPYQLSFLTEFELLGGTKAKITVDHGGKPVAYYTEEGLVRRSGDKLEIYSVDAHLNNDFQKGTERHSVWQDGRGFELRKHLKSGREQAVTTRMKLHDGIRPDARGWFADGVFIDSNHYSEDLLSVPELKIAHETPIAGSELLRIEGEIPSGTLTVWLNTEKPATLKRASFKASPNWVSEQHGMSAFSLEVEVLEYVKIDEVTFPTKAAATYTYETPGEPENTVNRLTTARSDIQLDPDFDSMNAFQIDFSEGMSVVDYGANIEYTWVHGELQRKPIYRNAAHAGDDIQRALERAGTSKKHVLLQYGANSSDWCYKLHDLFNLNEKIHSLLNAEYELVLVNVESNQQIAEHYDTQIAGLPFLTVLDADGKKLADQETRSLRIGSRHDPDKVLAFLKQWKGTPLNARTILKDAKVRAEKEDKLLFVHFGAPGCGWCRRLESLLAHSEMVETFGKKYIDVKIDLGMANSNNVQTDIAANHGVGIPWYAMLDPTGKTLATSDGPQGNTGYPCGEKAIDHFIQAIRSTAKTLDPNHLARIETFVRRRADEIQSRQEDPS